MFPRSFYFVRHGETDWNRDGILQGFSDIPLNETGRAQARAAVGILRHHGIDRIVASPLSRARETAEIINTALGKPLSFCEGLRERHFGALEGKSSAEIDRLRQTLHESGAPAEENGYACPEGAETYADFKARIFNTLQRELTSTNPDRVMFVCHGGVYRVLGRALLGVAENSPNVQPFIFDKTENKWRISVLEKQAELS